MRLGEHEVAREHERLGGLQTAVLDAELRLAARLARRLGLRLAGRRGVSWCWREDAQRVDEPEVVDPPVRPTRMKRVAEQIVHAVGAE
jgi:hypothetical protein